MNYLVIIITLLIAGQTCFTQDPFDPKAAQEKFKHTEQTFKTAINKAPMELNSSVIHTPNDSYNLKPCSNTSNKADIALLILSCVASTLPIASICKNKKVSLGDGCLLFFFIINISWNGRVCYKNVQEKQYTQNFSKNLESPSKKITFTRS